MTDALLSGAREVGESEGVSVIDVSALEVGASEVIAASALALCTPANFGYMSGALKHFFDRVYYPCLEHTRGRPYALVVKGSSDVEGAVASVQKIVRGLQWREVLPPLVVLGAVSAAHEAAAHEMGQTLAAGLAADVF